VTIFHHLPPGSSRLKLSHCLSSVFSQNSSSLAKRIKGKISRVLEFNAILSVPTAFQLFPDQLGLNGYLDCLLQHSLRQKIVQFRQAYTRVNILARYRIVLKGMQMTWANTERFPRCCNHGLVAELKLQRSLRM